MLRSCVVVAGLARTCMAEGSTDEGAEKVSKFNEIIGNRVFSIVEAGGDLAPVLEDLAESSECPECTRNILAAPCGKELFAHDLCTSIQRAQDTVKNKQPGIELPPIDCSMYWTQAELCIKNNMDYFRNLMTERDAEKPTESSE